MTPTRRSVLRLWGAALGIGLAGCSTASPSEDTETTVPTSSPTTPSAGSPDRTPELEFSAEMLSQSSAESPARVAASLSNVGSETVGVGMGPALLFSDNGPGDSLDWSDKIVLDPQTYIGPWSDPVQTDEGCWRFPEDGSRSIQSILEHYEIEPQQSISEAYDIYTTANSDSCLPEGTHRFQDKGIVGSESQSMVLTLALDIDENQQLSATTEEPTVSPE